MSANANVNKPVNKKEKEADVNRKLQLYGIINAFQNGKVPSVSCTPNAYPGLVPVSCADHELAAISCPLTFCAE